MLPVFLLNSVLITLVILIHYEALYRLSQLMPHLDIGRHRARILVAVFGILIAHVAEMWLFGFGYYFMLQFPLFGSLMGNLQHSLLDCVYFSFTCYSSLGFGDIQPLGPLRFTSGLEALTGLVMISWTASFLFIEMQKFWSAKEEEQ